MTQDTPNRAEVDRFILDHIESVPHPEALLLLRQHSEQWTAESVAKRLWINAEDARNILEDLVRDNFIVAASEPGRYTYRAEPGHDRLLQAVADAYRGERIRISTMIHAKPSSAVRAFARAFRFTKDQE